MKASLWARIMLALCLALVMPVASIAQPLPIITFDSGAVNGTATVANSSHSGGQSIGGLITVPIGRTFNGSGIITQFQFTSPGGSTGQYVVRIWQKQPSGSTVCNDNQAFVSNSADDMNLITAPFAITPAAPSVTTGDAKTYASQAPLTWSYHISDNNPTKNLYVCLVTVSTNTADDGTNVVVMMSGPQD